MANGRLKREYKIVPGLEVLEVVDIPMAIEALRELLYVEYAEPDYIVTVDETVSNDPRVGELWGMANIQAPLAWDTSTGDPSVMVAIIDTGIDYTHPDLAANMWTNPGEIPGNTIDDDGNGYVDDVHGYDFANSDGDPACAVKFICLGRSGGRRSSAGLLSRHLD